MGRNDKEKENELVELFKEVKKAADRADEARCLDAFKLLKDFHVDGQMLASTKVGMQLRPLTKHPKETIRVCASEMLGAWKKLYLSEHANKSGKGVDKSLKPTKLFSVKIQATQATTFVKIAKTPISEAAIVKKHSTAESDQDTARKTHVRSDTYTTVKSDSTTDQLSTEEIKVEANLKPEGCLLAPPKLDSLIKCYDDLRDKVRESLYVALSKVATEVDENYKAEVDKCDPGRVSMTVESAMFEKWGRTNESQRSKYRSFMFNINDSKNPDFRRKVLLGHIPPEKIPSLSAEDMASDTRRSQNDEIKRKALLECERESAPQSTTDQFKCGKCEQRKTTYYQMQTRSADEPMTTFVTCVNCNHHWKFC